MKKIEKSKNEKWKNFEKIKKKNRKKGKNNEF